MKKLLVPLLVCVLWSVPSWAATFQLEVAAPSITVYQGTAGINHVHVSLLSGSPIDVTMSASGLPAGVTVTYQEPTLRFDREGGHPPYASTSSVYITTTASTPIQNHTITLSATGSSGTSTASFVMTVAAIPGTNIRYVATNGTNNLSCGAIGSPCQTIQYTLSNRVSAGDTVLVRPGTYVEQINFPTSGTGGSPIRLIGENLLTTIIDGNRPVGGGWSSDPDPNHPNVYLKSNSAIGFEPTTITYNGKFCLLLDDFFVNGRQGRDRLYYPQDHTLDAGPDVGTVNYWDYAGCYAYSKSGVTYVRIASGGNPGSANVTISADPLLLFDGKSNITVRGFTLQNGTSRAILSNSSSNIILEHNRMLGGGIGIVPDSSVSNTIIRYNEATLNHYYADTGHLASQSELQGWAITDLRQFSKETPPLCLSRFDDGVHGIQFSYNHIYRNVAGLVIHRAGSSSSDTTEINNNYMHHLGDYPILSGNFTQGTVTIHDNLMYGDGFENWRWGEIASGAVVYFYKNRMGYLSYNVYDIFYQTLGNDLETYATDATIYMYHNTFAGNLAMSFNQYYGHDDCGGGCQSHNPSGGHPNVYMVNNIFSTGGVPFAREDRSEIPGNEWQNPRWHFGYNWVGGATSDPEFIPSNQGWAYTESGNLIHDATTMWNRYNPSYQLASGSDARNAGINLATTWNMNGSHAALPGMSGYADSTPDLGAIQFGAAAIGAPSFTFTADTPVTSGLATTLHVPGGVTGFGTGLVCTPTVVSGGPDTNWTSRTSAQLIAGGNFPGAAMSATRVYRLSCTDTGGTTAFDQTVTLAIGTIAKYTFNEGTGSIAADTSGNPNTHPCTLTNPSGGWVTPGIVGAAGLAGDGTRSCHTNGVNEPDLMPTTEAGIGLWLKATTTLPTKAVYAAFPHDALQLWAEPPPDGRIICQGTDGTNWPEATSPSSILTGTNNHASCSYAQDEGLKLRVNNVLVASAPMSTPLSYAYPGGGQLRVGTSDIVTGDEFMGQIDAVYFFDRRITDARNTMMFNEQVPITNTAMVHSQFAKPNAAQTEANLIGSVDSPLTILITNLIDLIVTMTRNGPQTVVHYGLECSRNGGTFTAVGAALNAAGVAIAPNSVLNMGDSTVVPLPTGLTVGTATPVAGRVVSNTPDTGVLQTLNDGEYTQWRYSLRFGAPMVNGNTLVCRPQGMDTVQGLSTLTLIDPPSERPLKGMQFRGVTLN